MDNTDILTDIHFFKLAWEIDVILSNRMYMYVDTLIIMGELVIQKIYEIVLKKKKKGTTNEAVRFWIKIIFCLIELVPM